MSSSPRYISILIPCHDAAPWLAATLESALNQTHPHCQIIVVDDGSRDDSAAIAERFSSRGVQLIRQEQRGAAAARNTALRHARGDFVQFLDADDLLHPNKISRQLQAAEMLSGLCLAAGPWGTFTDTIENARFVSQPVWNDLASLDWLVTSWSGGGMVPPAAWLAPRTLIDAAGPWNESLSLDDDGEFFTRVLLRANGVKFVPGAIAYYRQHGGRRVSGAKGRTAALSSFKSSELKEHHLLSADDSARTRRAVACNWQRFAWEQLVDAPELARAALARARMLAPNLPPPDGPRAYRVTARLLGWPRARRLQLAARRLLRR